MRGLFAGDYCRPPTFGGRKVTEENKQNKCLRVTPPIVKSCRRKSAPPKWPRSSHLAWQTLSRSVTVLNTFFFSQYSVNSVPFARASIRAQLIGAIGHQPASQPVSLTQSVGSQISRRVEHQIGLCGANGYGEFLCCTSGT